MQNDYRHMNDGSTRIEVLDQGQIKEIIIDTEDFEKVSAVPGIWSVWRRTEKNMMPVVGTSIGKKNVPMNRLIMDCEKGKVVYNITRNFLDMRKKNLVIAKTGETNSRAFAVRVEQLMEERQLSLMDPHVEYGPQVEKESPVAPQLNSLMIQEIKTYVVKNGKAETVRTYIIEDGHGKVMLNEENFNVLLNFKAV